MEDEYGVHRIEYVYEILHACMQDMNDELNKHVFFLAVLRLMETDKEGRLCIRLALYTSRVTASRVSDGAFSVVGKGEH